MHNSAPCGAFKMLYHHYLSLVQKHFHHSKYNSLPMKWFSSHFNWCKLEFNLPFLIEVFIFSLLSFELFASYLIGMYFSQSVVYLSIIFIVSFTEQNFVTCMRLNLLIFPFMCHAFGAKSKYMLLQLNPQSSIS